MQRYEAIESIIWQRDDGATASIYGACPWTSDAERPRWQRVHKGWTIRNNAEGRIGIGRKPFATQAEAEAHILKMWRHDIPV